MNRLLSRPALALSRTSVRNGGGHVMNDETIMHWKKVKTVSYNFYYFQVTFLDFLLFLPSFPLHWLSQQGCQNSRTYDPSSMEPSEFYFINFYDSSIHFRPHGATWPPPSSHGLMAPTPLSSGLTSTPSQPRVTKMAATTVLKSATTLTNYPKSYLFCILNCLFWLLLV